MVTPSGGGGMSPDLALHVWAADMTGKSLQAGVHRQVFFFPPPMCARAV